MESIKPEGVPKLEELPDWYEGKERALAEQKAAADKGATAAELEPIRMRFRWLGCITRVTDKETGNVYELQTDHRTIIAKNPAGDELWKVNPFVDAKLSPYRFKHPIIVYFGKGGFTIDPKKPSLGITFNSSQFGSLDLKTGAFTFGGQD